MLILVITLLANRLNLNTKNSSKARPCNRQTIQTESGNLRRVERKQGEQSAHIGATLEKVDDPDIIEEIDIDHSEIPIGKQFMQVKYQARQVFRCWLFLAMRFK